MRRAVWIRLKIQGGGAEPEPEQDTHDEKAA